MATSPPQPNEIAEDPDALKRLRQALDAQRDLPAVSGAPARLASLAGRQEVRVQDLVEVAFADPGLALRLIRVANGSTYGNRDRTDVLQVERAITLLGLEQVRNEARRMPAIQDKVPPKRRQMVRDAIGYATFSARFARTMLDSRNPLVSSEGAVSTLIACLPEIALSLHSPHELAALRYVRRHHPNHYDTVVRELLGMSLAELGAEIAERWSMPRSPQETIARSGSRPTPVVNGREWLVLSVGLSMSVSRALRHAEPTERSNALQGVVRRFAPGMTIDKAWLDARIEEVAHEAIGLERSLGTDSESAVLPRLLGPHLRREPFEPEYWTALERLDATGTISQMKNRAGMLAAGPRADDGHLNAVGKPADGARRLGTVLAEVREMVDVYLQGERDGEFAHLDSTPHERVRTRVIPTILRGVLEGLGYDKVLWFEHRPDNEDWMPQAAAGARIEHFQGLARTRIAATDLFGAVLANGIDLHIADCTVEKISHNLPGWFRVLYPSTRSFLIVPVRVDKRAIGFILADRACTDPIGLTADELRLTREMRDALAGLLRDLPEKKPATV